MSGVYYVGTLILAVISGLVFKDAGLQWWGGLTCSILAILMALFGAAEIIANAIRGVKK